MQTTEKLHLSPVHERLQMSVVRSEPGIAVLSMPLTDDVRASMTAQSMAECSRPWPMLRAGAAWRVNTTSDRNSA